MNRRGFLGKTAALLGAAALVPSVTAEATPETPAFDDIQVTHCGPDPLRQRVDELVDTFWASDEGREILLAQAAYYSGLVTWSEFQAVHQHGLSGIVSNPPQMGELRRDV